MEPTETNNIEKVENNEIEKAENVEVAESNNKPEKKQKKGIYAFIDGIIRHKTLICICIGALAMILLFLVFTRGIAWFRGDKQEQEQEPKIVNTRVLRQELEKSAELTAAKLKFTFKSEFKDTGIPVLTKGDFIMIYDVQVRAGVDLNEVEIPEDQIDPNEKVVHVYIPKAKILDEPWVNPDTIEYFDEKFTLFNPDLKEDANRAQKLAQDNARERATDTGILELADKQSEAVIKGILAGALSKEGYTVEIHRKEEPEQKPAAEGTTE